MTMLKTYLKGAVLCALGSAAVAQSPLTTINPFASNNGGAVGGGVYFDLTVNSGVVINQIDSNFGQTAGTVGSIDVYTIPGTYVGNETTMTGWTLVGSASVTAAGIDQPSVANFATPIVLTPGTYGVAICANGLSHRYTNGTGTNQTFSTAEMTINLGSANNTCFVSTPFSPRVWNGAIHYTPANGTFASFSATPTTGSSPLSVAFTDTSYSSNTIVAWEWDFENDGVWDDFTQNPTHVYPNCGTFDVALRITDNLGNQDTKVETGLISVDPLVADFTATPTAGAEPLLVQFTDTSTGGSATPIAWEWDFDNDGTVDDVSQNPTWPFFAAGSPYTVSLTVTFDCGGGVTGQASETKADLIQVFGATTNTAGADLFEFQFNEVRGTSVANAASTSQAPSSATVNVAGWQIDAGRTGFKGDGATGALGNSGLVATGHALNQNGSMTISWWQRMNSATGTSLAYAFGGAGGSWRCFTGGVAGNGLWYRGSSIGDVTTNLIDVQANPGVWEHVCLVVDDVAGTAEWYLNGVPDGPTAFTPGTHTAANTDYHIGYHTSTTSIYTDHYDMDDFRHYNRALSPAEVLALFNGTENPAATNYGTACAGGAGTPTLTANGAPDAVAGNPGFAISLAGAQPLAISAVVFGYGAGTFPLLPLDLGTVLGPNFAGCMLETDALVVFAHLTDPTGAATQPIPISAGGSLSGTHLYGQWVTFDTTVGSLTAAIDINVE